MGELKIESAGEGFLWVSVPYSTENVARMKQIAGRQWNPDRKQWRVPDTAEARKVLAEIVALPPAPPSPL